MQKMHYHGMCQNNCAQLVEVICIPPHYIYHGFKNIQDCKLFTFQT